MKDNKEFSVRVDHYKAKLFPYAYNILGDRMESEDVIQEVLNKYFLSPQDHIEHHDNYLIRSVINRSINQKKALMTRKEKYLGQWLPSPLVTEEKIYFGVDREHILNYSLLLLLEDLNPKERAVFILREAFDYSHADIAETLNINADSSRQLLKRGRQKVQSRTTPNISKPEESRRVIEELTEAILDADMERVKNLLSDDIQTFSDGGSKANAARNTIMGKDNVYKLLMANYGKYFPENTTTKFMSVNHKPAILYFLEGKLFRCTLFDIEEGKIRRVYIMVNPDKLDVFY